MNRFRAGAIHLAISAAVAAAIFLPIYFVWYPGVLFESAGGRELFLLVACVDVTLGPLITTIVFRQGKRGMKFDLAVIAALQLTALAYGVSVLFESRPVYIVFVKDRFELVRATQVVRENLGKSPLAETDRLSIFGPVLMGSRMPTDADEKFKLSISGLSGSDVQTYPQYHVPYAEARAQVREKLQPIAVLRKLNPAGGDKIDRLLSRAGAKEDDVGFLPLRAGKVDLSVLVDKNTGDVLGYSSLRPWEY